MLPERSSTSTVSIGRGVTPSPTRLTLIVAALGSELVTCMAMAWLPSPCG